MTHLKASSEKNSSRKQMSIIHALKYSSTLFFQIKFPQFPAMSTTSHHYLSLIKEKKNTEKPILLG